MTDLQNIPGMKFEDYDYVGKKEIEAQENKNASPVKEMNTKEEAPFIPNIPLDDTRYQSVNLPSNFIFYDFDNIRVRKFELRDLSAMQKVVKTASNKLFKETIQRCVDRDINLLTPGDFKYLCYWLRLNSYPRSPMTIEWTSKYGNKNVTQVYKENITVLAPDITKEQLKQWRDRGFEVPVLKFADIFDEKDENSEDEFLYSNAQFFKGNTWEEKIKTCEDFVNQNGLEALKEVNTFDELIYHGVEEELTVTDSKFDPQDYKKNLETRINKLKLVISNVIDVESEEAAMLNLLVDNLQEEYATLIKKLDAGEVVQADPETIFLEMEASEFLSPLLSTVH